MSKGRRGGKNVPTGNYPVGYCRPPEQHRFKRGEKRQPKDRIDKDAPSLAAILDADVTIIQDGRKNQVHSERSFLMRKAKQALNGNVAALKVMFDKFSEAGLIKAETTEDGGVVVIPKAVTMAVGSVMLRLHGRPPWPQALIDRYNGMSESEIQTLTGKIAAFDAETKTQTEDEV